MELGAWGMKVKEMTKIKRNDKKQKENLG